jgi:hypothetical protein
MLRATMWKNRWLVRMKIMNQRLFRIVLAALADLRVGYISGLVTALCSLCLSSSQAADDTFFETKIRPVLVEHCYSCHSLDEGEASGELLLDSASNFKRGGGRGSPFNLEKPDESLLLKVLSHSDEDLKMPPEKKLSEEIIADFRTWLLQGAPDPRSGGAVDKSPRELVAERHWAYQTPKSAEVSGDLPSSRALDRIDAAIEMKLQEAKINPSAQADRFTLIRRTSFDLLGVPPAEEILAEFMDDVSPDAYTRMVDRLLASPQFGEKWARHWMDVSRYADTKGYVFQEDRNYATAYRYRDWLIAAFNQDMPYDQFVRYQLAADQLDPNNEQGHLDAMGFLTLGRRFLNNQQDIIDDRIDVVGRGLMGLTIACARCHDHKYDPVSQADYYSLYGVFLNSEEPGGEPSPLRMVDSANEKEAFIFLRGAAHNRGDKVPRRFVKFLSADANAIFSKGSGRLELADSIVNSNNPLAARVIVNRVWMRLIGRPLIDSPSDLGVRANEPKLQVVLDELATGLMERQWSLKHLVRRIVLSATYQQSSLEQNAEAISIDPENRLVWRMNRKRLDFEGLRDNILESSGALEQRIGGPSVAVHEAPFTNRRTVYSFIDRQNFPGLFRAFDVASPDTHNPQRSLTTVPQQGLFLLNSDWIAGQAEGMVNNARQAGRWPNDDALVTDVFQRIYSRQPSGDERRLALEFLSNSRTSAENSTMPLWQYGYGNYSVEKGELLSFNPFPAFVDGTYRGVKPLPDDQLGWASLNADGGHTGNADGFSVVRRWNAPFGGKLQIIGNAEHPSDQGNGVRIAVVLNDKQQLATWEVRNGKVEAKVEPLDIPAGSHVDLIVHNNGDTSHDSFRWRAIVRISGDGNRETYSSSRGFEAPPPRALGPEAQLVQALLASNEVAFVD